MVIDTFYGWKSGFSDDVLNAMFCSGQNFNKMSCHSRHLLSYVMS